MPTGKAESGTPAPAETGFSLRQRIALWFISIAGELAIRMISSTMRYSSSAEDDVPDPSKLPEPRTICPFWHRAIFTGAYVFRETGYAVMTSRSFDGEYIARIASSLGLTPVRGSSSRGAVRALLGMHKVIEAGNVAAFTIDGPKGPPYVAKPGPVLLARHTGAPIRCFYIAVSDYWTLNSWDKFVIPKPFSRAYIRWAAKIHVPPDADAATAQRCHDEMQAALERVTMFAEAEVRDAR